MLNPRSERAQSSSQKALSSCSLGLGLGPKCRKWQTSVSNCIDLGQLLHLEPTHLVSRVVHKFIEDNHNTGLDQTAKALKN
jgi:hypothetical protein